MFFIFYKCGTILVFLLYMANMQTLIKNDSYNAFYRYTISIIPIVTGKKNSNSIYIYEQINKLKQTVTTCGSRITYCLPFPEMIYSYNQTLLFK